MSVLEYRLSKDMIEIEENENKENKNCLNYILY